MLPSLLFFFKILNTRRILNSSLWPWNKTFWPPGSVLGHCNWLKGAVETKQQKSPRDNLDMKWAGRAGVGGSGGVESKKWLIAGDHVNTFLRCQLGLSLIWAFYPSLLSPGTNPDTEVFTTAERAFSCDSRRIRWPSRQLAGSCSKGALPFRSFLGLASWSMAQSCVVASVGSQKSSEYPGESS